MWAEKRPRVTKASARSWGVVAIALGKSILYAENRMISYHAVEASKTNILIDAIDAVVRSVTNDASEFGN